MPEALYRLAYDATIEDAVDTSWRLANRTRAFRRQFKINVVCAGIAAGIVLFGAWMYIVGTSPVNIMLGGVVAILFGMVFSAVFLRIFETEIRKQHRKVVAEQFGGKPFLRSELELRPDAVWVRQAGMEMLFPWSVCTAIHNNPGDIEMNFTPGICVVYNRHFPSPAEREAFIETALRLLKQAPSTDTTAAR
jgi:hypothetical protein